ncbi:cell wall glucanase protein [Rutstroemia sp. NJR-2017a BVV2]|nr:cell wall glucanase protein [Rutstroemia sp. NJR-2017a BVV2]
MTEPPPMKPWDLSTVIDFVHTFSTTSPAIKADVETDPFLTELPEFRKAEPVDTTPRSTGLGDFSAIWEFLGKESHLEVATKPESCTSTSSSASQSPTSNQSTPTTSADEDVETLEVVPTKEVRWKDEVHGTDIAGLKKSACDRGQRQSETTECSPIVAGRIFSIQSPSKKKNQKKKKSRRAVSDTDETSGLESEAEALSRRKSEHAQSQVTAIDTHRSDPRVLQPLYNLTIEQKRTEIIHKLTKKFRVHENFLLRSGPRLGTIVGDDAVHVFVDCSNVVLGFYDALKRARSLPETARVKASPFSFRSLAFIMERNRPVARRVLVGSRTENSGLPTHFAEAEECGYEVNILDRVFKARDDSSKKLRGGVGNGYLTGYSSGSETPVSQLKVKSFVEQGVDEILHMKLLESLVDTHKPATIVLASGDGAEAEYSGGFFKNVERALLKGWKVEIIAWKNALSFEYRSKAFQHKWKKQFTVVELDDFSEELLAVYATA